MLFEPPPRPEDLSVIHETSHGYQESRKFRIRSNQNTKKNLDIFKDMNIPKVISILAQCLKIRKRPHFTTLRAKRAKDTFEFWCQKCM